MSESPDDAVLSEARRRVENNPTDLQLRFELGRALAERGMAKEALVELQKARQNPNCRGKALRLQAECYEALGMADLAENTRRTIKDEKCRDEKPGDDEGPGGAASPAPLHPVKPGSPGAEQAWPEE